MFLTCSIFISLGKLDLNLVLPGDVLNAAAFGPHHGTVVALRDGNLHTHLGLLLQSDAGVEVVHVMRNEKKKANI